MNLRDGYYREMTVDESTSLRRRAESHGCIAGGMFYGGGYTHGCNDCSRCATGDTTSRCPVCNADITEETTGMSSKSPFACSCGTVVFVCAAPYSHSHSHDVGMITSFIPAIKDLSIKEDVI